MRDAPTPQDRPRAAVIDDDDDIRVLICRGLVRGGFQVVDFSDGETLFADGELGQVDLVVSDIGLPGADGIEVCASVLERHPGLPVILVTAFRDDTVLHRAQVAGASHVLTKPLDIGELVTRARELAYARLESPSGIFPAQS